MWVVKCESCGVPLSLRSKTFEDACTPGANRLRRKYRGKLVQACKDFPEVQLCQKCFEKKKEASPK